MDATQYTAAYLATLATQPREYASVTETERRVVMDELESILRDAGIVAFHMKERQMPLYREQLMKMLKYSRQQEGAEVSVEHALNGATRYFLQLMQDKGFRLTQYYAGEPAKLFSPQGPQRLMLHW